MNSVMVRARFSLLSARGLRISVSSPILISLDPTNVERSLAGESNCTRFISIPFNMSFLTFCGTMSTSGRDDAGTLAPCSGQTGAIDGEDGLELSHQMDPLSHLCVDAQG